MTAKASQRGVILVVVLLVLLGLSLMGIRSLEVARLDQRRVGFGKERLLAFQQAESARLQAETWLTSQAGLPVMQPVNDNTAASTSALRDQLRNRATLDSPELIIREVSIDASAAQTARYAVEYLGPVRTSPTVPPRYIHVYRLTARAVGSSTNDNGQARAETYVQSIFLTNRE